jgi:hypothetical protein
MDLQNEHGFWIQQYPQPMHSSRGLVFPIITAVITFLSSAPVYNKRKENAMPFVIHDNALKIYCHRRVGTAISESFLERSDRDGSFESFTCFVTMHIYFVKKSGVALPRFKQWYAGG